MELVAKISDYGLSRVLDAEGFANSCCGTKLYFAPEVWFHPDNSENYHYHCLSQRYVYDAKIELFSFGLTMYLCYVGRRPFFVS